MRVGGKVFHQAHNLDKSGSIPEHRYFAASLTVLSTLGVVETEESKTPPSRDIGACSAVLVGLVPSVDVGGY